uniref:Replicase large subunit n=1 Tax=Soybean thrips virga-like virus 1 TaxID=2802949 RepID=A0A7T8G262_9VIRU|nr:polyprotein [Soybean thrips virga-like virus 1]
MSSVDGDDPYLDAVTEISRELQSKKIYRDVAESACNRLCHKANIDIKAIETRVIKKTLEEGVGNELMNILITENIKRNIIPDHSDYRNVRLPYAIDGDHLSAMIAKHPNLNISMSEVMSVTDHPIAANLRIISLAHMMTMAKYQKDFVSNVKEIEYVLCIVGHINYEFFAINNYENITIDAPILDLRDGVRNTDTLIKLSTSIAKNRNDIKLIDSTNRFVDNNVTRLKGQNSKQHKALTCLFLHSTYDMSFSDIAKTMYVKGSLKGYGCILYHPMIHDKVKGKFPYTGVLFRRFTASNGIEYIKFTFPGAYSLGYTHRWDTYVALITSTHMVYNDRHYLIEKQNYIMENLYFVITYSTGLQTTKIDETFSHDFSDSKANGLTCISTLVLDDVVLTRNSRYSIKRKNIYINTEMFDQLVSAFISIDPNKYTIQQCYQQARSINSRISFSGNVLWSPEYKLSAKKLLQVTCALYVHVYIFKNNMTDVVKRCISEEKENRDLTDGNIIQRVWTALKLVVTKLHDAVFDNYMVFRLLRLFEFGRKFNIEVGQMINVSTMVERVMAINKPNSQFSNYIFDYKDKVDFEYRDLSKPSRVITADGEVIPVVEHHKFLNNQKKKDLYAVSKQFAMCTKNTRFDNLRRLPHQPVSGQNLQCLYRSMIGAMNLNYSIIEFKKILLLVLNNTIEHIEVNFDYDQVVKTLTSENDNEPGTFDVFHMITSVFALDYVMFVSKTQYVTNIDVAQSINLSHTVILNFFDVSETLGHFDYYQNKEFDNQYIYDSVRAYILREINSMHSQAIAKYEMENGIGSDNLIVELMIEANVSNLCEGPILYLGDDIQHVRSLEICGREIHVFSKTIMEVKEKIKLLGDDPTILNDIRDRYKYSMVVDLDGNGFKPSLSKGGIFISTFDQSTVGYDTKIIYYPVSRGFENERRYYIYTGYEERNANKLIIKTGGLDHDVIVRIYKCLVDEVKIDVDFDYKQLQANIDLFKKHSLDYKIGGGNIHNSIVKFFLGTENTNMKQIEVFKMTNTVVKYDMKFIINVVSRMIKGLYVDKLTINKLLKMISANNESFLRELHINLCNCFKKFTQFVDKIFTAKLPVIEAKDNVAEYNSTMLTYYGTMRHVVDFIISLSKHILAGEQLISTTVTKRVSYTIGPRANDKLKKHVSRVSTKLTFRSSEYMQNPSEYTYKNDFKTQRIQEQRNHSPYTSISTRDNVRDIIDTGILDSYESDEDTFCTERHENVSGAQEEVSKTAGDNDDIRDGPEKTNKTAGDNNDEPELNDTEYVENDDTISVDEEKAIERVVSDLFQEADKIKTKPESLELSQMINEYAVGYQSESNIGNAVDFDRGVLILFGDYIGCPMDYHDYKHDRYDLEVVKTDELKCIIKVNGTSCYDDIEVLTDLLCGVRDVIINVKSRMLSEQNCYGAIQEMFRKLRNRIYVNIIGDDFDIIEKEELIDDLINRGIVKEPVYKPKFLKGSGFDTYARNAIIEFVSKTNFVVMKSYSDYHKLYVRWGLKSHGPMQNVLKEKLIGEVNHSGKVGNEDLNIYDNCERVFILAPRCSYEAGFDGKSFVKFEKTRFRTTSRYVLVGKSTKVMTASRLSVRFSDYDISGKVMPRLILKNGVAGCGKTYAIVKECDIENDIILTSTRKSKGDLVDKLSTKLGIRPEKFPYHHRIRTLDSLCINVRFGDVLKDFGKIHRMWVDECGMSHAGEILIAAIEMKAEQVICFGDKNQIGFYDSDDTHSNKYASIFNCGKVEQEINVSVRIPADVAAVVSPIYKKNGLSGGCFTTNTIKRSMSVHMLTGGEQQLLRYRDAKDTHLLVMLQDEKDKLTRLGFKNVNSIHEFQGLTTKHIVVVRFTAKQKDLRYKKAEHALVAITRHTVSLEYYVVCKSDYEYDYILEFIENSKKIDPSPFIVKKPATMTVPKREKYVVGGYSDYLVDVCIAKNTGKMKALKAISGHSLPKSKNVEDDDFGELDIDKLNDVMKPYFQSVDNAMNRDYDMSYSEVVAKNELIIEDKYYQNDLPSNIKDLLINNCCDGTMVTTYDVRYELPNETYTPVKQNHSYHFGILQDVYDRFFPGRYEDVTLDQLRMQYADLDIYPENISFVSDLLHVDRSKNYDTLSPVLRTHCPAYRTPNAREIIGALLVRNLGVSDLQASVSIQHVVRMGVDAFCSSYIAKNRVELVKFYQQNKIECNLVTAGLWLETQPTNIDANVDPSGIKFKEVTNKFFLMLKNPVKVPLSGPVFNGYNYGQIITFLKKMENVFDCNIFKQFTDRFLTALASDTFVFTGKSPQEHEDLLNAVISGYIDKIMDWFKIEGDFSQFDKSQGEVLLLSELEIYRMFGVDEKFLEFWYECHRHCTLYDRINMIKVYVDYQRKSGTATTFIGNTIVTMIIMAMLVDMRKVKLKLFCGDDSLLISDEKLTPRSDQCATLYNMVAKFYTYKYMYFCSKYWLIIQNRLHIVPDIIKLIVKLGRRDLVNFDHVEEYRRSLSDLLSKYSDANINFDLSMAVAERYDMPFYDLTTVIEVIFTYVGSPMLFASLYYQAADAVINQDPSRPSIFD